MQANDTTHLPRFEQQFPRDIRSVRAIFNLEATTVVYATCPKCLYTHEPVFDNGIPVYPLRCTFRAFPTSSACGAKLTTTRVHGRESIRAPLRPFVIQSPESFIAEMLSRPGMEEVLSAGMQQIQRGQVLDDVMHGSRVRSLSGPDGKPFFEAPVGELRLFWTFSTDFFNPFYNKAAGKSVSIGSIVLVCLNLPPHLRYKSENMYIAGIIPGPREPDVDQINHFLSPILGRFHRMWQDGIWFTRTACYPRGRLSRSAIAGLVTDLPAARKLSGMAHHKMRLFCAFCLLNKADINNIDWCKWEPRTWQDILQSARRYRDAPDQATRDKLFQETGVRWSAFMDLPYWDNTICVVVDGMHYLFLGLVSHHVRSILGVDSLDVNSKEVKIRIDEVALRKARQDVSAGVATSKQLLKLNVPTLVALHQQLSLPLPPNFSPTAKGTKRFIISAIQVSISCFHRSRVGKG